MKLVANNSLVNIVSECSKLCSESVQDDNVAKAIYLKPCEKWGFQGAEKMYM